MAKPNEEAAVEVPAAVGKKRWPLVVAAVVLLLAIGGGLFAWLHKAAPAAGKAKAAQAHVLVKAELYLPLDPAFVVNLRDGDSLRYLQVGITLMSHDPKAFDVVKGADPVVRDALLTLFSSQSFATIVDPAGRAQLQAKALATVQKIVKERSGSPGIDALYFTSFVIQ
ncbi:MAG: flagellar basal body-associated FliL family protein [Pseudomonadota bacterium]|jgi:flagellar FliL protein|nr:flagellar basal body-associated FliL family protein [Xanthomonadaceae bacterium]MDE3211380.1 flagellar basal body-associated FliL family protein [Pseudomonadota bacterium]